ncbi:hypothetical protein ACFLSV_07565 [Bacteroidota bacterium]
MTIISNIGMVNTNGGVKQSGNAREGIKYAIEEMTERKILVMQS